MQNTKTSQNQLVPSGAGTVGVSFFSLSVDDERHVPAREDLGAFQEEAGHPQ